MTVNRMRLMLALGWVFLTFATLRADVKSRAAAELAETMLAKFGAKAGRTVPALAQRIEGLAAKHGEEAVVALRKVGPSAFGLIEKDGAKAVRVLAQHGEAGATRVLNRPQAMSQYLRFGEDAAAVLVKHPSVGEKLVESGGLPAVKALAAVTPRNGRRVAIVLENELANTGKHAELLRIIAQYGDRGAQFVWENKGALAVGTTLTAFLLHPEPFISGAKEMGKVVGESTVGVAKTAGEHVVSPVIGGLFNTAVAVIGVVAVLIVALAALMWKYGVPGPEAIEAAKKAVQKK